MLYACSSSTGSTVVSRSVTLGLITPASSIASNSRVSRSSTLPKNHESVTSDSCRAAARSRPESVSVAPSYGSYVTTTTLRFDVHGQQVLVYPAHLVSGPSDVLEFALPVLSVDSVSVSPPSSSEPKSARYAHAHAFARRRRGPSAIAYTLRTRWSRMARWHS